MASNSDPRSITATLSGSTADTVTLTQAWPGVDITNHDATNKLYIRYDGTTAVGAAAGTTVILPGQSKVVAGSVTNSGTHVISVVGNGNIYTVEGVN